MPDATAYTQPPDPLPADKKAGRPHTGQWTSARKIGFRYVVLFVLLFILTLPFPHHFLPDIGAWLSPLFESLARWSGRTIFGLPPSFTGKLISDSTGLYLHTLNVILIALMLCGIWSLVDRRRENYAREAYWFVVLVSYYLALQLFVYGFDKVFKVQFYLPEPNTLYTTVGETPRDLLYWTVMGASRPYTIFTGLLEVIAACLLLFRRTRTAGAVAAFAILLNVLAINLSFDISVKLYSSFLLLLCIVVAAPDATRLKEFFLRRSADVPQGWTPQPKTGRSYLLYASVKALAIALILFDALSPYVASGNFNDDTAARPPLHGAYQVKDFFSEEITDSTTVNTSEVWKRIFVHRQGYLVVQTMDDKMHDYTLRLDTARKKMILTDPVSRAQSRVDYTAVQLRNPDRTILTHLRGELSGKLIEATVEELNLKNLPLLRNEFHWTTDGAVSFEP